MPSEPPIMVRVDLTTHRRAWPMPVCRFCGDRGWVWEPHANHPFRHREDCPARCKMKGAPDAE